MSDAQMNTGGSTPESRDDGAGDLPRRILLGAVGMAGIGALAAMAKAGPINPPAGAVAPTGRTLDEVYNKIPGANGSGDGRIPIPGGTTGVAISQPGSYVLTGNITSTSGCISVSASDVTLDLNGFTLTCTTTTGLPLFLNSSGRIVVRNGTVVGGLNGVSAGSAFPTDLVVEDVIVRNAKQRGIYFAVGGQDRLVVRRCSVYGLGTTTTSADVSLTLQGILVGGNNARVEECHVCGMTWNGTGSPQFFGIQAGGTGGGVISRCTVSNATSLAGVAFIPQGGCVYRENTVNGFVTAYLAGGVNGGGNYP